MRSVFLLDMDDTLLDFARAERENLLYTFSASGVSPDERLLERFHAVNDGLWRRLERGELSRERLKVLRFELIFEEFGIAADADAAARTYYEHFPEICFPFAGAAAFLRDLSARGRVYIVTNGGTKIQRAHIALAGFAPFLTDVFISEEIGADKPSEAYVDYVRTHIEGFDPAYAVYLGDSLTSDMVCAKRLGVDFVLFIPRPAPHTMPTIAHAAPVIGHGPAPDSYAGPSACDFPTALALMT